MMNKIGICYLRFAVRGYEYLPEFKLQNDNILLEWFMTILNIMKLFDNFKHFQVEWRQSPSLLS